MKLSLMDFASLGILGCALALTGVSVKREFFEQPSQTVIKKISRRPEVQLVGQVLGSKDAKVPVVVFADFQCPYCAKAQPLIRATLAAHEGNVNVLYRHLPLESLHPHAWRAAVAAECAGEQGKFETYHDLLYAKQDSIGKITWEELGARVGVRALEFQRCLEGDRLTNAVERDVLLAQQLGIDRTPAFVVGDEIYSGIPPARWLDKQIAAEIRRIDKP